MNKCQIWVLKIALILFTLDIASTIIVASLAALGVNDNNLINFFSKSEQISPIMRYQC